MKKPTLNPQQTEVEAMLPEYDFRGGVRGKHARPLETAPLSESHRAELERRLADLDENPDTESPWEEVRARLEQHSVRPTFSNQPNRAVRN